MKTILPFTLLASGCFIFSGFAQFEPHPHDEHEPEYSEVSVTLYADADYRGESVTLLAEAYFDDLDNVRFPSGRKINNRISSIWIEGHAHVTLFDYSRFRGESITLMESEADLDLVLQGRRGDWDNDVSSISVGIHPVGVACAPGPVGLPYPSSGPPVIGGSPAQPGSHPPAIGGSPSYPGSHPPVVGGYPTHPRPSVSYPIGPSHGQSHGPVFYPYDHHYRMDPAIVRQVERAYRDVLRRSPDEAGRRTYYWTMIERDWSESRLRKELRKSDEYHKQTIPAVVKKVYREVLGREPDSAGFQFYTQKMSRDGWYESRLRDALKKSPEYTSRGRSPVTPTTG